jgi:hypothetical protein
MSRVLLIAFSGLLMVGAIIYFWPKPVSKSLAQGNPSTEKSAASSSEALPPRAEPQLANPGEPATKKSTPDNGQRKAYLAAFLTPISFWGKVVDEKDNPVPGATVKLGANSNPNPMEGGTRYERITDSNGLFSITDANGISLSVEVSKEGHYSTEQSRGTANYVLKNNRDLAVPTADAPAIFVLRKMGETVALIRVAQRPVRVPKNGSPVEVSLRTGKPGAADRLKVECWTEDQNKDVQGRYNWRCRLSVPGGGLIERTDQFGFEAPADAYQSVQEITMSQSTEKWKKGVDKEYFAKLPGNYYARFTFGLTTGGEHFFVIESYLNPISGSRNLEYDPNKPVVAGN